MTQDQESTSGLILILCIETTQTAPQIPSTYEKPCLSLRGNKRRKALWPHPLRTITLHLLADKLGFTTTGDGPIGIFAANDALFNDNVLATELIEGVNQNI